MLFRKRIKYCCSYCANGTQVDDDQVLCIKRGVVFAYGKCRKFIYDPLKRAPKILSVDTSSLEFPSLDEDGESVK